MAVLPTEIPLLESTSEMRSPGIDSSISAAISDSLSFGGKELRIFSIFAPGYCDVRGVCTQSSKIPKFPPLVFQWKRL